MSWIKATARGLSYLAYLLVTAAVLLEVVFRVLPTSDSLKTQPVTVKDPVLRFAENRTVTKQVGFDFKHVNVKRINNYGFASDRDFLSRDVAQRPVISVIGDSYVEALQVQNEDTFHAKLDQRLENFDAYPFGVSGSQLSQYLAFADFAKAEFVPEIFVFLIVSNDFDESWFEIKNAPGFHYFNDAGALELVEYSPSAIKAMARQSAFVRYLVLDLKLAAQIDRLFTPRRTSDADRPDRHQPDTHEHSETLGMKAIDLFLANISKLAASHTVVLMLDGDRNAIYDGQQDRDRGKLINRWFSAIADGSKSIPNVHLLDLHPRFSAAWANSNQKFNYEYDYHWNERGHALAAEALASLILQLEK